MVAQVVHIKKLPDSGKRQSFGDGQAVREADPNKPALEGISPYALWRLGMLLTKANLKYGDYRNWEKGMPITRYIGGIQRHTALYQMLDTAEDHLAAIMWNAMCILHHEEVGSLSGKSFEELDDRPRWKEAMQKAPEARKKDRRSGQRRKRR